ncbi:unnamed protein product [Caenorhabditis bovis]|uniref:G-protein coupled receptors family 1 profile domain-containing protein n=1 Tax=Caenorhabditis bovis TaxID=2654633 RepID=A0A8S1EQU7_9PELO|nr:unnamed protein product [Caenorhabditis bovis]CAB3404393.1 unnamed protein product [Caenorhabditis bovis]
MSVVYLVTEIISLVFAALSFLSNNYIIYLFFRKRIPHSETMRLALYLAYSDLGYAIAALIHIGYLAINWSYYYLNYNPYFIIYTNAFLPAFLKMIAVTSLSMAADRILAIFVPAYYRRANRITYANATLALALALFTFDFVLQIVTAKFEWNPNCGTMQCFVNRHFLIYVGYSNTVVGLLIFVISIIVFCGLYHMQNLRKVFETETTGKAATSFRHANRVTIGILFSSLFFVTIPSLLVTLYENITGISLFAKLGPFYICAILINGFADSLVFIILNVFVKGKRVRGAKSTVLSMSSVRNK